MWCHSMLQRITKYCFLNLADLAAVGFWPCGQEWCLYTPHLGVRSSRILQDFESRLGVKSKKSKTEEIRNLTRQWRNTNWDVREKILTKTRVCDVGTGVTWFNYNVRSDISLIVLWYSWWFILKTEFTFWKKF